MFICPSFIAHHQLPGGGGIFQHFASHHHILIVVPSFHTLFFPSVLLCLLWRFIHYLVVVSSMFLPLSCPVYMSISSDNTAAFFLHDPAFTVRYMQIWDDLWFLVQTFKFPFLFRFSTLHCYILWYSQNLFLSFWFFSCLFLTSFTPVSEPYRTTGSISLSYMIISYVSTWTFNIIQEKRMTAFEMPKKGT